MSIQSMHHLFFKRALLVLFLTISPFLLSHSAVGEEKSHLPENPLKQIHIGRSYLEEATHILAHMKEAALKSADPKKQYEIFIDLLDKHLQKAHAINPKFGYIATVNLIKEHIKSLDLEEIPLEDFLKNSPLTTIMAAACITLKKDADPQG